MSDYQLKITVRNARIMHAMRAKGFSTVAELCRAMGTAAQTKVGNLINCKTPARKRGGEWCAVALDVSSALGEPPEALFSPRQQTKCLLKNSTVVDIAESDLERIAGPDIENLTHQKLLISDALQVLSDRERRVIGRRFAGGELLEDVANDFGCSSERIRQIEKKAIRKLRCSLKKIGVDTFDQAISA